MASAALPALRPLALGELLDRTIRLYRSNFFRFIGIIAVVQIPFNLLALLTTVPFLVYTRSAQENPGEYLAPFFGFSLLTTLVSFVGGILYQSLASAALTRAVVDGILGTPASVFGAYRRIGSTWWKLILALLLMSLINIQ